MLLHFLLVYKVGQAGALALKKRVAPTIAMLFQHRGPLGFAGCQAAVTHRAVCLFSLPSSWPYGAWGSYGHGVSQICLCVWKCAFTRACACVCVYVLPVCEKSQICSLVSVDLAAGRIDFVSICIFLPAKNTFISSTEIEAGNTSESFHILLCWT